jgi:hypothetical protein
LSKAPLPGALALLCHNIGGGARLAQDFKFEMSLRRDNKKARWRGPRSSNPRSVSRVSDSGENAG